MGKAGYLAPQRLKELNLNSCVGHVVFPAKDMSDAQLEVVNHRGKGVEGACVFPHQNWIGKMPPLENLRASDRIFPANGFMIQLEAPMRLAALSQQFRLLPLAQLQSGAIIDRRATSLQRKLSFELQFLAAFPAGVKPPCSLEALGRRCVAIQPFRLARLLIPLQAQPKEILADGVNKFFLERLSVSSRRAGSGSLPLRAQS